MLLMFFGFNMHIYLYLNFTFHCYFWYLDRYGYGIYFILCLIVLIDLESVPT